VKRREAEKAVTLSFHSNGTSPWCALTLSRGFLDPLESVYAEERKKREKEKHRPQR
jgi:hypothetical protein